MIDLPFFDSSRKALEFALNSRASSPPGPVMNRMMAAVKVKRRVRKGQERPPEPVKRTPAANALPTMLALDKAHLAGFIRAQFQRLEPEHRAALAARTLIAHLPCACGTRCCRGTYPNPEWVATVDSLCHILQHTGNVLKIKGKKGLSSQPVLRRTLVEAWSQGLELSGRQLASMAQVSPATAAQHAEWITVYLQQTEDRGWGDLDAIFDQMGITGQLL